MSNTANNGKNTGMTYTTACCGFDCKECPLYGTQGSQGHAMRCTGCRGEGIRHPFCDDGCQIRRCVMAKGIATCAECSRISSCPTVAELFSRSPKAKERLLYMRPTPRPHTP